MNALLDGMAKTHLHGKRKKQAPSRIFEQSEAKRVDSG